MDGDDERFALAASFKRKRLMDELAEVARNDLPGISVVIGDQLHELTLVLTPASGPRQGQRLLFDVTIPGHYPDDPPKVKVNRETVEKRLLEGHPNVFKDHICLSILNPMRDRFDGDGYTPAYSLSSIFLQILSFFSSEWVEQEGGHKGQFRPLYDIGTAAANQVTLAPADALRQEWNNQSRSSKTNTFHKRFWRTRDVLIELTRFLSDESILTLASAYWPFDLIVKRENILLHRETQCFYLRTPLPRRAFEDENRILGFGIAIECQNANARNIQWNLESEFDIVSWGAVSVCGQRESVLWKHFDEFLPLAFSRNHFDSAKRLIIERIGAIYDLITRTSRYQGPVVGHDQVDLATQILRVLPRLINYTVVRLCDTMKDRYDDDGRFLRASEKALDGYCHLVHLLLVLSDKFPQVRQVALDRLRNFRDNEHARHKNTTPDMGEFLVLLLLAQQEPDLAWANMSQAVCQEVFTRNVLWILRESPELAYLEDGSNTYRKRTTWNHSKVSLRLFMFQVTFLELLRARNLTAGKFYQRLGQPPEGLATELVERLKAIIVVGKPTVSDSGSVQPTDPWPSVFMHLRIEFHTLGFQLPASITDRDAVDPATGRTYSLVTSFLRDAVRMSYFKSYHDPHQLRLDSWSRLYDKRWSLGDREARWEEQRYGRYQEPPRMGRGLQSGLYYDRRNARWSPY